MIVACWVELFCWLCFGVPWLIVCTGPDGPLGDRQ